MFDRHLRDAADPEPVLTRAMIHELSDELAHKFVGLPYKRPMTAEDIAQIRDRYATKDDPPA
jgi:hypothetical protein